MVTFVSPIDGKIYSTEWDGGATSYMVDNPLAVQGATMWGTGEGASPESAWLSGQLGTLSNAPGQALNYSGVTGNLDPGWQWMGEGGWVATNPDYLKQIEMATPEYQNWMSNYWAAMNPDAYSASQAESQGGGGLFDMGVSLLTSDTMIPILMAAGAYSGGLNADSLSNLLGTADTGYIDALGGMTDSTGTALSGWSTPTTTAPSVMDMSQWTGVPQTSSTITPPTSMLTGTTPSTTVFPGGVTNPASALTSGSYVDPYSAGAMTSSGGALPAMTPAQLAQVSAITGMDTAGITAALSGATAASPGILSSLSTAINSVLGTSLTPTQLLSSGASILGGVLSGNAAQDAAQTTANAQLEAARIAAEAAKFKPIGVTTRFGSSNFQKDAQGNVIGAGYMLTPDVKAQQDALMGMSNQMLTQYQGAPQAFAPMGTAGQRAMSLGNQYLATDPQAQAAKYMADQQALLATGRERDVNNMLTGEFNRGTYGLSTGSTSTGMMGANPRLEALYNAQRQQDLGLAAQATQGGMDYAKFGAGMVDVGGALTRGMYDGQTAAFNPYKTALGGAQTLEGLGQNALTLGMDLGRQTSNAAAGNILAQGMVGAAQTNQAAAYSPWGTALMSGANSLNQMTAPQQQQTPYAFNPYTGQPIL